MGNVRLDSVFESGAARGRGGAAGLLPAVMRGFKVQKCLALPYRREAWQDRDFSSSELDQDHSEVIRFSSREAENCAAHQLTMICCLFADYA